MTQWFFFWNTNLIMPQLCLTCLRGSPPYMSDKVKTLQLTWKAFHNSRDSPWSEPSFSPLSCLLMLFPCTTWSNLTVLLAVPQMCQGPHYQVLRHALSQLAISNFSFFVLKTQFRYNLLYKDFAELSRWRFLSSVQPLYPEENLNIADHLLYVPPMRTEIL